MRTHPIFEADFDCLTKLNMYSDSGLCREYDHAGLTLVNYLRRSVISKNPEGEMIINWAENQFSHSCERIAIFHLLCCLVLPSILTILFVKTCQTLFRVSS